MMSLLFGRLREQRQHQGQPTLPAEWRRRHSRSRHLLAILAHQPSFAPVSHLDHAFCGQHRPSGAVSILAGLAAFFYTGMTTQVLLMVIAIWAIIISIVQIWGAIELRRILDDTWLLGLAGALAIAFGVIMIAKPGAGALALVWTIGWFAIVFGGLYIALAFQLRKFKRT
jgi:hypothetical protein